MEAEYPRKTRKKKRACLQKELQVVDTFTAELWNQSKHRSSAVRMKNTRHNNRYARQGNEQTQLTFSNTISTSQMHVGQFNTYTLHLCTCPNTHTFQCCTCPNTYTFQFCTCPNKCYNAPQPLLTYLVI